MIEEKRSAENLIHLIQQYMRPETTIYSDLWKAYISIPRLREGYSHGTDNHSKKFVSSEDSDIHTQNTKSLWAQSSSRHNTYT